MTNLELWQLRMRDICSPDAFIEAGFYAMIAAALERRVWEGPAHKPLYPSIYVILVGDPGVGKGEVIRPVATLLKHHKLNTKEESPLDDPGKVASMTTEQIIEAQENQIKKSKKPEVGIKYLFTHGPQDITYEGLTRFMSNAVKGFPVPSKPWYAPHGVYFHKSVYFAVEEMSSIFKRNSEKVSNFMLNAYDAGDYDYLTKHHGEDVITKLCLTLLVGTTPKYIQETFSDNVLTNGFASRAWFVFEFSNKPSRLDMPALDEEQIKAEVVIKAHLKALSQLHGEVKFTTEARAFLRDYFEVKRIRVNKNFKMESYYARQAMHLKKASMLCAMGESDSMVVELQHAKQAVRFLEMVEQKAHYALLFGSNKLSRIGSNMLKYLKLNGPKTWNQLRLEFWEDTRDIEFEELIKYIVTTGLIITEPRTDATTGKQVTYYCWISDKTAEGVV